MKRPSDAHTELPVDETDFSCDSANPMAGNHQSNCPFLNMCMTSKPLSVA